MPTATPTPKLVPQARKCKNPRRAPRGRPTERVFVEPVRVHLQHLMDEDPRIGLADIARAVDLAEATIRYLMQSRVTVQRFTAEALLAVTVETALAARVMQDVAPTREHLEEILRHSGCTQAAIAAASGMDLRQISEVLNGTRVKVHRNTERHLLNLTVAAVRRKSLYVSPRKTVTMLRALQANGHSLQELGTRLGLSKTPYFISDTGRRLTRDMERKVAALYAEIGDRPGPSDRARGLAGRLGYYPPIHYDEDMRLIPESIPRPSDWIPQVSPQERSRRYLRIMGLTLREYTAAEIADMMKVHPKLIERARKDTGLRLNANRSALLDLPYVRTGQDELVAAITVATAGVNLMEEADVLDTPDIDHVALWAALLVDAERIRSQPSPQTAQTAA